MPAAGLPQQHTQQEDVLRQREEPSRLPKLLLSVSERYGHVRLTSSSTDTERTTATAELKLKQTEQTDNNVVRTATKDEQNLVNTTQHNVFTTEVETYQFRSHAGLPPVFIDHDLDVYGLFDGHRLERYKIGLHHGRSLSEAVAYVKRRFTTQKFTELEGASPCVYTMNIKIGGNNKNKSTSGLSETTSQSTKEEEEASSSSSMNSRKPEFIYECHPVGSGGAFLAGGSGEKTSSREKNCSSTRSGDDENCRRNSTSGGKLIVAYAFSGTGFKHTPYHGLRVSEMLFGEKCCNWISKKFLFIGGSKTKNRAPKSA